MEGSAFHYLGVLPDQLRMPPELLRQLFRRKRLTLLPLLTPKDVQPKGQRQNIRHRWQVDGEQVEFCSENGTRKPADESAHRRDAKSQHDAEGITPEAYLKALGQQPEEQEN